MTTGEKIRQLRIARNMTMDELGEKVGVQKSCIKKYELDKVDLKLSTIKALADALGCSPIYLCGFDENEPDIDPLDSAYLCLARDAKRDGISTKELRLAIKTIKMFRENSDDEA